MELPDARTETYLYAAATVAAEALAQAHTEGRPRAEGVREALLRLGFLIAAARERGDDLAASVYEDVAHETRRIYA